VGKLLAAQLGWDFIESDDFHSAEDVRKMTAGIPLTDEDRQPWLEALHRMLLEYSAASRPLVLACSALKENYRQVLAAGLPPVLFVYLKGNFALIQKRMLARQNHYMKAGMLRSQFEVLEEPYHALVMDITQSPVEICTQITHYLARD
jgi:gluconokinase